MRLPDHRVSVRDERIARNRAPLDTDVFVIICRGSPLPELMSLPTTRGRDNFFFFNNGLGPPLPLSTTVSIIRDEADELILGHERGRDVALRANIVRLFAPALELRPVWARDGNRHHPTMIVKPPANDPHITVLHRRGRNQDVERRRAVAGPRMVHREDGAGDPGAERLHRRRRDTTGAVGHRSRRLVHTVHPQKDIRVRGIRAPGDDVPHRRRRGSTRAVTSWGFHRSDMLCRKERFAVKGCCRRCRLHSDLVKGHTY